MKHRFTVVALPFTACEIAGWFGVRDNARGGTLVGAFPSEAAAIGFRSFCRRIQGHPLQQPIGVRVAVLGGQIPAVIHKKLRKKALNAIREKELADFMRYAVEQNLPKEQS